jgi:hypothetical protein
LLDRRFDDRRYAFTVEHSGDRVLGLLSDEYYFMMRFDGSDPRLHRLDSETPRNDVSTDHPELARQMADYTAAMRDTIQYMRENNKPGDIIPGEIRDNTTNNP